MSRRRIMVVMGVLFISFVAALALLSSGPPITLTVVGKTGRRFSNAVVFHVKLQNHRHWTIFYRSQDGPGSAFYRVSRRNGSGWQELKPEQYQYLFPITWEKIDSGGSTTTRVYATETDSTNELRMGFDCYSAWDFLMWAWRWNRFSIPTTVWSAPQPIDCAKNSAQEIPIMVEEDGSFGIGGTCLTEDFLAKVLKKASAEFRRDIPIVVTSRKGPDQSKISPVINVCTSLGFTNITLKMIDAPLEKNAANEKVSPHAKPKAAE